MNNFFGKILIPVDFSVNTKVALKKALMLSGSSLAEIHLLHVFRIAQTSIMSIHQYFSGYPVSALEHDRRQAKNRLEEIKAYILSIRENIQVHAWVSMGMPVENAIAERAKLIGADLVIIAKNSHHSWLPFLNTVVPSRIAKKTGIAVLTVKPGSIDHDIRTVVVSVGKLFPDKKLMFINSLRKKIHIQIRLVSFLGNEEKSVLPASLLNAYRLLKNNPENDVSYEILYGNNKAKAILTFCKKVNADLLIVAPESETRIGWLNRHISDVLPTGSKTQILAVRPI